MLEALNNILQEDNQNGLCISLKTGDEISVSTLASDLAALKVKVDDVDAKVWFLYADNSYYFLLGLLLLLGLKKKVIISANIQSQWLAEIECDFDAVLADTCFDHLTVPKVNFELDPDSAQAKSWQPSFNGTEELCFYTSGSTGQPKKIAKPFISLLNEIETLINTFDVATSNSVYLATVSHHHIYGLLFKLLLPLLSGKRMVLEMIEYPEQIVSAIETFEDVTIISSPAFLSRLDPELVSSAASAVFSSGGPLSYQSAQEVLSFVHTLPVEVYGSTETGGIAYRQQESSNAFWQTFPNIALADTDEGVSISSPHIADAEMLLDDVLQFHSTSQFELKGRRDRIVNIEEKRVSLLEMEAYLSEMSLIEHCIVLVTSSKRAALGGVLVLSEEGQSELDKVGSKSFIDALKGLMRKRFDAVTIPKKWRIIKQIPVNTQSKVDTQALLNLFHKE